MIYNHMIKCVAAVPRLKIGNPNYNMLQHKEMMHRVKDTGLLVFPELSLTGYTCGDLFQQEWILEEVKKSLLELANETSLTPGMTVVVGAPIRHLNKLYNCGVVLSQGKIKGVVPKSYIPNYGEFYEARWFASGKDIHNETIAQLGNVPFGVDLLFVDERSQAVIGCEICEDLWVLDKPSNKAMANGANIIVNLSASDELIGKKEYRENLVKLQSATGYCGYIYCSSGSDESSTDLVFSSHCIIAENGRVLTSKIFEESPVIYSGLIDLDMCAYNRIHQNTFSSYASSYRLIPTIAQSCGGSLVKANDLAKTLIREAKRPSRFPFVPKDETERSDRCKAILQIQAQGLATRLKNTGITNVVIGISGGLDSTLALLVCHEAKKLVKDMKIIAYTMPNRNHTTSLTYDNANKLMELLADECHEVAIEETVKAHLKDIGHSEEYEGSDDTAYENAQARMRTYILMDVSNMRKGLVVGTGDLSELALGWCTYNGDHMSMYAVNASIPKTLVQYICEAYAYATDNTTLKETLLSIINTPITPELTPSDNDQIAQKTEEKIGKYDLNDFFLYYCLRYGADPERILAHAYAAYEEMDEEVVKEALMRFYKRFYSQQFKRSCLPDGPKVGSVTLSPRGDWRMPSDADVRSILKRIVNA